jgi:acetyl esterase/lipase
MLEHSSPGRLLVGLAIVIMLAGCGAGASPTPAPATSTPTSLPSEAVATPTPTTPATATPAATPSVVVTSTVAYESSNPRLVPGVLDVYEPTKAGPWPVVVLIPAFERASLGEHARRVADLGFVVFVPEWGAVPVGGDDTLTYDRLVADDAQGACAIEFARAHAAEYGGDPGTMIVFGHSAGAHLAATVVFAGTEPSAGCLADTTPGAIDALVTWEGDWLIHEIHPPGSPLRWDRMLAADARVFDAVTPLPSLARNKDLKVVILVSEDPNASLESEFPGIIIDRPVGDPWAADSWLAVRDPSGDLRRQLEANGALADGKLGLVESQQLLYSVLKAQGNPVSLDVMPDSSHAWLAGRGWDVFLAAFPKAAAKG